LLPSIRILVVEDEETLRSVLGRVLRRDDHEVVEAASAEEALEIFREEHFPLVLTDIVMGGMTGLELLAKVKEIEPETIVVVMTSHSTSDNAIEALRSGAYDFLTKPFEDLEVVKAVVNRALENIQLVQENLRLMDRLQGHSKELESLNTALATMANRDGLTGMYNHRYFHDALERELVRAKRFGNPVSLIFMDLDDFKKYNDVNGHIAGDELLKSVSALMKALCRRSDVLARYGGEEFVMILSGADKEGASVFAERLREEVENFSFAGQDGQDAITISIGVASYPEDARNISQLIDYADQALYEAKNGGRNRVMNWSAPTAVVDS
jgi:diguanylate cyclase (GGDEF)-like protein